MVILYKKWKKYNEIQLTKNKMDLNIRKILNEIINIPNKYKKIKQIIWDEQKIKNKHNED